MTKIDKPCQPPVLRQPSDPLSSGSISSERTKSAQVATPQVQGDSYARRPEVVQEFAHTSTPKNGIQRQLGAETAVPSSPTFPPADTFPTADLPQARSIDPNTSSTTPRQRSSSAPVPSAAPLPESATSAASGEPVNVQPTQALSPRAEQVRTRLANDSLTVMNTQQPTNLSVHGVDIPVYGANAQELSTIRRTLERLPASHLRAIPRIVIADTIANGNRTTGGNSIDEARAEHLSRIVPFRELHDTGLRQQARLEVTRAALNGAGDGLSSTLLHETGHFVDWHYRLSGRISPDQLGDIRYGGVNRAGSSDPRGPVPERFADAYSAHFRGRLHDRAARATVERVLATIPQD